MKKKTMKKKIVIADDNANIRLLLHEFLRHEYDVYTFEDGKGIVSWLKIGNLPDLIISDIKMPHIDGHKLIEYLKDNVFYMNIPILVLSGIEKTEEKIKFLQKGADDYIIKPFNPLELQLRIKNIFKHMNHENIN
ncbi:MAG: PleD family two-component system response regulator [Sphingobacteriaceae bacterium]